MIFLIPFTPSVWFWTIIFSGLIVLSLRIALGHEIRVRRKQETDWLGMFDANWSVIIAEVVGALAQQGKNAII